MKRPLRKVYEPAEGITHVEGPVCCDAVTLCGKTDWIGEEAPEWDTDKPVNCQPCRWIFDHCNRRKWPA